MWVNNHFKLHMSYYGSTGPYYGSTTVKTQQCTLTMSIILYGNVQRLRNTIRMNGQWK